MPSTNLTNDIREVTNQYAEFHAQMAQLLKNPKFNAALNELVEHW